MVGWLVGWLIDSYFHSGILTLFPTNSTFDLSEPDHSYVFLCFFISSLIFRNFCCILMCFPWFLCVFVSFPACSFQSIALSYEFSNLLYFSHFHPFSTVFHWFPSIFSFSFRFLWLCSVFNVVISNHGWLIISHFPGILSLFPCQFHP